MRHDKPAIDLSFRYNDVDNSFELNVNIEEIVSGRLLFLHGNSGCGKTTLLNLISGVIRSNYSVLIRQNFPNITYVMHESTLLPWGTIYKSISVEEHMRKASFHMDNFLKLCENFGLSRSILYKRSVDLSLGMRQRVEIAKALSFSPDLLLLDEAFSGIDEERKKNVLTAIYEIAKNKNIAVIGTAHQLFDLLRLAEEILWLQNGKVKKKIEVGEDTRDRLSMSVNDLLLLQVTQEIMNN